MAPLPTSSFVFNHKLLAEVIQSLGNAFAIPANAQGAAALLNSLLRAPKLSAFVIVRERDIESIDPETLHGIMHPTLVPCDTELRVCPHPTTGEHVQPAFAPAVFYA